MISQKILMELDPMKNRHILAMVFLCLAGGLVYVNTLQHEFVWDDNFQIVRNPYLNQDEPVTRIFTTDVWGYTKPGQKGISNYYRPLQMLSYRWINTIFGLNPFYFHLVNICFHSLVVILCYAIFWYLTQDFLLTIVGTCLFALHPIHSEAVAWIAALPELGCALLMFFSFLFFLMTKPDPSLVINQLESKNVKETPFLENGQFPTQHRLFILWCGSLISFMFALLWKEMALTLPILIAAYQFVLPRGSKSLIARLWLAIRQSLPYLGVVGFYLCWRYYILGFISRRQQALELNPAEFVLSSFQLVSKYWLKLLLPLELNSFHVFEPVRFFAEFWSLASIGFLILVGVILWISFRRAPLFCFLVMWVFISLAPVLNLSGVGINVFAERYLYIPSLGFCLLLTWTVLTFSARIKGGKPCAIGFFLITIVLYGLQTYSRNQVWKNDLSLYSQTVLDSPNSALIRNSYAQVLSSEKNDPEAAEQQYRLAIEIASKRRPKDLQQIANAFGGLGGIYAQKGQYEKALEAVEKGIATGNYPIQTGIGYGLALMHLGRLEEAAHALLAIHKIYPNDELVLDALGVLALGKKEFDQAVIFFKKAIRIVPSFASAHNNLGRTYLTMGHSNKALVHLKNAVSISPDDPVILTNLGTVLADLGRTSEGIKYLERAIQIAPNYQPASNLLKSFR